MNHTIPNRCRIAGEPGELFEPTRTILVVANGRARAARAQALGALIIIGSPFPPHRSLGARASARAGVGGSARLRHTAYNNITAKAHFSHVGGGTPILKGDPLGGSGVLL